MKLSPDHILRIQGQLALLDRSINSTQAPHSLSLTGSPPANEFAVISETIVDSHLVSVQFYNGPALTGLLFRGDTDIVNFRHLILSHRIDQFPPLRITPAPKDLPLVLSLCQLSDSRENLEEQLYGSAAGLFHEGSPVCAQDFQYFAIKEVDEGHKPTALLNLLLSLPQETTPNDELPTPHRERMVSSQAGCVTKEYCIEIQENDPPHHILRNARQNKKMRQTELAALLCIKQSQISRWESGREPISQRMIHRLAAIFTIPPERFIGSREKAEILDNDPPHLVLRKTHYNSGISREEIAQRLGLTPNNISIWEAGRQPIPKKWAVLLAEIFKIPVERLVISEKEKTSLATRREKEKTEIHDNDLPPILLTKARINRRMSQTELARQLRLPGSLISDWESGQQKIPHKWSVRLSEIFGFPAERFIMTRDQLVIQTDDLPRVALLKARLQHGKTREQLSDPLGLMPNTILEWELGQEPIPERHAHQLAHLLAVPVERLFVNKSSSL